MADAAEVIAEWEKDNPEPAEVPAPQEPSPEPSPQEPEATVPPTRFSLDDVLPDDERLPKSMRGKRVSDLVEYNREKDIAAQKASFEKNAALEKAEAFKSALEVLTREVAGVPRGTSPAPAKKLRGTERMREHGVEAKTVYSDADTAFDAVHDASVASARESIVPEVENQLRQVQQQVNTLQQQALNGRVRGAFLAARPANVPLEDWEADAQVIGAYVVGQNKSVEDVASYKEAGSWLEEARSKRAKPQAAPPPPVAPAPPVGNGQAAPPSRKSAAKVSTHVMGAFNEVTSVLNDVLKGVGGDGKLTTNDILEGMRDIPKYKEMFD